MNFQEVLLLEVHCHQEIPEVKWTVLLESFLTGKAQRAYHVLTEAQKEEFPLVKKAILAAYKLTPDAYRERFHSAYKLSSETFGQYSNRLNLCFRRWTNPSDDLISNEEFVRIMDKIVADRLISSLRDENLRIKLLEQKWVCLAELTEFADSVMVARASSRGRFQRPPGSGSYSQPQAGPTPMVGRQSPSNVSRSSQEVPDVRLVTGKVSSELTIAGETEHVVLYVADIPCQVLVGRDILGTFSLVFDIGDSSYWSEKQAPRIKYPLVWVQKCGENVVQHVGAGSRVRLVKGNGREIQSDSVVCGKIEGYDNQVKELVEVYADVFVDSPGFCDWLPHRIDTGDANPVRRRQYKLSPSKRAMLKEQISQMLQLGIIVPSTSEWASPVVMVEKKDGTYRLAIDYRAVNAVTKQSNYPIPIIETILHSMYDSKVFSTFDLSLDFGSLPSIRMTSIKLPLFVKRDCLSLEGYHGLRNASQQFQNLVDIVFQSLNKDASRRSYYPYIDDIVIHSANLIDHLKDLRCALDCLRKAGLTVNPAKCHMLCSQVKFLGYIVDSQGVRLDPSKCSAVREFPQPTDKKSLERFLGLSGWCAKFVQHYSTMIEPLNKLRKKNAQWKWSDECQSAFEEVKQEITTKVSLTIPDFKKPFELHTDASGVGLGAALVQQTGSGDRRVIEFASRVLTPAEKNYSVTELECLAVVWAFDKWRPYLECSNTTVFTDHQALVWMLHNTSLKGRRSSRACIGNVNYDKNVCFYRGCKGDPAKTVFWIQCEGCEKWFHWACLGLSKQEVDRIDKYFCTECSDFSPPTLDSLPTGSGDYSKSLILPDMNKVILAQQKDPDLLQIIQGLINGEGHSDRKYILENGLLMFMDGSGTNKVVVPEQLIHEVITHYHCTPTCPHLGIRKTVSKIQERFYWKGVRRAVERFVKRCRICQLVKPVYQKPTGYMESTSSVYPWHVLAMDIIGPFPQSKEGNLYILVFTDHFSKFCLLYTLKRATGRVVATVVRKLFCLWGSCGTLVSDNGPQMVCKQVAEVCILWGVKRVFTTPYHPQSNWVERVNRNLVSMLASFVKGDHQEWDKHVPEFMFALNSYRHDSTGFSPAELFLGRRIRGPGEWVVENQGGEGGEGQTSRMFTLARENMRRQTKKNKIGYDKKRQEVKLKLGDRVLLKSHPLSNLSKAFSAKLAPKWRGPYVVKTQLSPVNFVIQGEGTTEQRVAHVDQLKCIDK
ncbi:hypothetical protein BSL78_08146 [Apostichopus japonicus]|uniref:Endonuclease n=1 Tax=Stichopus japonicus TaxID=307972 RepID=A0A2G8L3V0_STIJA|nr:hypothetical protein BSL78_08146 [Apostichopus japonicus]